MFLLQIVRINQSFVIDHNFNILQVILKRAFRSNHDLLQYYILKLTKAQTKYLGRRWRLGEWRCSNMTFCLTWIYNVCHNLLLFAHLWKLLKLISYISISFVMDKNPATLLIIHCSKYETHIGYLWASSHGNSWWLAAWGCKCRGAEFRGWKGTPFGSVIEIMSVVSRSLCSIKDVPKQTK